MNTDDNHVVGLRPVRNVEEGHAYDVLLNGECVGSVSQGMVSHDRKPRGSRIVTSRTHSLRWFASPGQSRGWTDTRWESVERVLANKLGDTLAVERLARSARVIREK